MKVKFLFSFLVFVAVLVSCDTDRNIGGNKKASSPIVSLVSPDKEGFYFMELKKPSKGTGNLFKKNKNTNTTSQVMFVALVKRNPVDKDFIIVPFYNYDIFSDGGSTREDNEKPIGSRFILSFDGTTVCLKEPEYGQEISCLRINDELVFYPGNEKAPYTSMDWNKQKVLAHLSQFGIVNLEDVSPLLRSIP